MTWHDPYRCTSVDCHAVFSLGRTPSGSLWFRCSPNEDLEVNALDLTTTCPECGATAEWEVDV